MKTTKHIWLIGATAMAIDYSSVLDGLDTDFTVIGRGSSNAEKFTNIVGKTAFVGGLDVFLKDKPVKCSHAIVAVGVQDLAAVTKMLIEYGIDQILVEKPAGLDLADITGLKEHAAKQNAHVYVAYNRRFYASTLQAKKLIKIDGGVLSFNYEFTEWSHIIGPLEKASNIKEKWFLANSTHVADLAHYLGGKPIKLSTYTAGTLEWHPSGSIFGGAGISDRGALFTYQANWESAGRWSVEMLTNKHRFIFKPMEKLMIQVRGSINVQDADGIDYSLDVKYKPGLYKQVAAFLESESADLCSIAEHHENCAIYFRIANY
jgi:predicted dehydrogenase